MTCFGVQVSFPLSLRLSLFQTGSKKCWKRGRERKKKRKKKKERERELERKELEKTRFEKHRHVVFIIIHCLCNVWHPSFSFPSSLAIQLSSSCSFLSPSISFFHFFVPSSFIFSFLLSFRFFSVSDSHHSSLLNNDCERCKKQRREKGSEGVSVQFMPSSSFISLPLFFLSSFFLLSDHCIRERILKENVLLFNDGKMEESKRRKLLKEKKWFDRILFSLSSSFFSSFFLSLLFQPFSFFPHPFVKPVK